MKHWSFQLAGRYPGPTLILDTTNNGSSLYTTRSLAALACLLLTSRHSRHRLSFWTLNNVIVMTSLWYGCTQGVVIQPHVPHGTGLEGNCSSEFFRCRSTKFWCNLSIIHHRLYLSKVYEVFFNWSPPGQNGRHFDRWHFHLHFLKWR